MTAADTAARSVRLIDTDSHVTEPADLWTSRLPSRWREQAPRPVWDESAGEERWRVGDDLLTGVGKFSMAGWREFPPSHPPTLAEADPASWDAKRRLERMDEYGIWAQVLYPNLIAFSTPSFIKLGAEPAYACVRAYNDFLTEFAGHDPARLLPIMMLPFWDLDLSLEEMERCVEVGHRGVLFASDFSLVGLPGLTDPHWYPLFAQAEEMGLAINFHVGFSDMTADDLAARIDNNSADHARLSSISMLNNSKAISAVVCSGLCHRFPELNFVSVESGVSWLPYLLESLDWHWLNFGAREENPHLEMPSFYFHRQVYGSFWFESASIRRTIDFLQDNVMFETDFPHSTSLSPGPASYSDRPRDMAEQALAGVPDEIVEKVFFGNAARVYNVE